MKYDLKEFIISMQRKAGTALYPLFFFSSPFVLFNHRLLPHGCRRCFNPASMQKTILEYNASLYSKIGMEDKLSLLNLAKKIGSLCCTVASSMSQQKEHLKCVDELCGRFKMIQLQQLLFIVHFIAKL
ncbi:hypothetical protein Dimus_026680 [Dionaea muscipula]